MVFAIRQYYARLFFQKRKQRFQIGKAAALARARVLYARAPGDGFIVAPQTQQVRQIGACCLFFHNLSLLSYN